MRETGYPYSHLLKGVPTTVYVQRLLQCLIEVTECLECDAMGVYISKPPYGSCTKIVVELNGIKQSECLLVQ